MPKPAGPTTIDAYLERCAPHARVILQEIRAIVHEAAPDAGEAIKYGLPTFVLHGQNLVHFGAFARHIGVYPIPATIEAFAEALAPYKQGKGSVQFPLDRPVPYDLIRRMVHVRVEAVRARGARRASSAEPHE